jgi:hypothetical protein
VTLSIERFLNHQDRVLIFRFTVNPKAYAVAKWAEMSGTVHCIYVLVRQLGLRAKISIPFDCWDGLIGLVVVQFVFGINSHPVVDHKTVFLENVHGPVCYTVQARFWEIQGKIVFTDRFSFMSLLRTNSRPFVKPLLDFRSTEAT